MKITLTISLLLLSNASFAQQAAPPPASNAEPSATVTKVVRVRYGIATKIAGLVEGGVPVMVKGDNVLNAVILRGPANLVASMEQTIRELDVPGTEQPAKAYRDIELIVSVIGASDKTELLPEGQISEALAPVVKQLRTAFPYKNYQLLSSMLLRSSGGRPGENKGVMKSLISPGTLSRVSGYEVSFEAITISEEAKPNIHLRNFSFRTSVPLPTETNSNISYVSQDKNVNIITDVDLHEGQKVVVGKANVDSSDLALFIVLTARLVE